MTVLRMDHVTVVVEDLDAAVKFFEVLGLKSSGSQRVNGDWVDKVNGYAGVDVEIAMLRSPDGGQLEVTQFHGPKLVSSTPKVAPSNVLGLRSVMFEVDDVDDTVARLKKHGGELVGEIANYGNVYRLCYVRGPGESIIALAHKLG